jgi:hypothetical protein
LSNKNQTKTQTDVVETIESPKISKTVTEKTFTTTIEATEEV